MKLYALVGEKSKDYISYGGKVLVHHDKDELRFVFPSTKVVVVNEDLGKEMMMLQDHPGLAAIEFPIRKSDFK